jgi:hypothetical protein
MQKHIIYSLFISLSSLSFTWAQLSPNKGASQAVTIGVSPMFSFAGNLFSSAGANNLSFSGSTVMYRKVYTENRAWRLRGIIDVNQSTTPLASGSVTGRSSEKLALLFSAYAGKEYFSIKELKKNRAWCFFVGWEAGVSGSSFNSKYNFIEEEGDEALLFVETRLLESITNRRLAAVLNGIAGVEYYFSEHFFVGTSLNIGGFIAYEFENKDKFQEVEIDQNRDLLNAQQPFIVSSGGGIELGLDNANLLLFSAGFAF